MRNLRLLRAALGKPTISLSGSPFWLQGPAWRPFREPNGRAFERFSIASPCIANYSDAQFARLRARTIGQIGGLRTRPSIWSCPRGDYTARLPRPTVARRCARRFAFRTITAWSTTGQGPRSSPRSGRSDPPSYRLPRAGRSGHRAAGAVARGSLPPLPPALRSAIVKKRDRYEAMAARALRDLDDWLARVGIG